MSVRSCGKIDRMTSRNVAKTLLACLLMATPACQSLPTTTSTSASEPTGQVATESPAPGADGASVEGSSAAPDPAVSGNACQFGRRFVPSVSVALGPVAVTVDSHGDVSFSLSARPLAIVPLSLSLNGSIQNVQPSCVTLALLDRERNTVSLFAIESAGEAIAIRGSGYFEADVKPGLISFDITKLCEVQVWAASTPVPTTHKIGCGSGTGFWTVQLFSGTAKGARTYAAGLQGRGIIDAGVTSQSTWRNVCPGWTVVTVGQFATYNEAKARREQLPGDVVEGTFVRFLSSDEGDRPANAICPPGPE